MIRIILLSHINFLSSIYKGNTGAASTVKEWDDFRDGKTYTGFPYAVWKRNETPQVLTQSPHACIC